MVANALKSAEILESQNISCEVVNFHTIKPIILIKFENALKDFTDCYIRAQHYRRSRKCRVRVPVDFNKLTDANIFGINDKYSNGGE